MKVYVLTMRTHEHRMWAWLGHFQTIGFPLIKKRRLLKVFRGYDHHDYANRYEAVKAMAADGHQKYQDWLDRSDPEMMKQVRSFSDCCQWGMLNILRKVASSDEPILVCENDAFFRGVTYDGIVQNWGSLVNQVGIENINVAMFTMMYKTKSYRKDMANLEIVDDFWYKGTPQTGQTANIYTPHGAQFILDNKPCYPNIERYLYYGDEKDEQYGNVSGVYSTRQEIIDPHFFANFDSFRPKYRDSDHWSELVKGEPF